MEDTSKNAIPLDSQQNNNDIAVIGMSCRFPGAGNYRDFWNNLVNGAFSVTEIPDTRWNWRDYYGDPAQDTNKTNSKWGGFIEDMDKFDPLFFNISPKEARYIDPQHRIFLEAAWHAVEDAGYSTESLSGKKVGVYVGVSKNDYAEMLQSTHQEISSFISTGTVHSILANRVSFLMDIRGKSEVVDTACSSSLVALHNAIRDMRAGNCDSALVGGVNALITPTMYLSHGKSGMLSSEGKCKTFDESSDGYVRGEGVGCIFIKPLARAIADNDSIIGIIKGTAVNHNGRSNSLTSPSVRAQAEVINAALEDAGVDAGQVSYIEAHGTATPLGDPIEISALKKVFSKYGEDKNVQCNLGALKTNIGHLESAAGIAGLIKVLLCMRHGQLPGLLHHKKLNPYIDLTHSPFVISGELSPWKPAVKGLQSGPLTAGVSSFGMGGVNAHVILQAYNGTQRSVVTKTAGPYRIPVSAKTQKQLKSYAQTIADFLKADGHKLHLQDIAFTLQNGRDVMASKAVFLTTDLTDFIAQLDEYAATGNITPNQLKPNEQLIAADGVRIALPGYPFERRRCWMDAASVSAAVVEIAHPLLTFSNNDQEQQWAYETLLKPADYFIRDHIVQGECMMPGVAYLEIARAVAEQACGRPVAELTEVCWMQSVKVYAENVPLQLKLAPVNTGFSFEITTAGGVHANGNILLKNKINTPAVIDLQNIKERCVIHKTADEIYQALSKEGLAYQKTFQTITAGYFTADEALCSLQPTDKDQSVSSKVWEPSLLDGVFQTVVGLCIWGNVEHTYQLLPFYLKSVRCYGQLGEARYAYVKKSSAYQEGEKFSFDMFLCDENGNVILSFSEFVKRAYKSGPVALKEPAAVLIESLHYTADWLERPLGVLNERPNAVIVFDTNTVLYESIQKKLPFTTAVIVLPGYTYQKKDKHTYQLDVADATSFKRLTKDLAQDGIVTDNWIYRWSMGRDQKVSAHLQDIYALLYLSQALITAAYAERIKLLFVYNHSDTVTAAVHQMAGGFARTLAYENPRISILSVGITEDETVNYQEIILQEITHYVMAPLLEVIYRQGRREERTVVPGKDFYGLPEQVLLKENGCYIITGGSGGLGMVFSAYLAEQYKAKIVLIGRSAKNEVIEEKLLQLQQLGGDAVYYTANVADKKAIASIIAKVKKKYKKVNGVIHAAGLIEDSFIINKKPDSFERVITPKIYGAINLEECLQNEALDFFIAFSSIASLMPNQGQCDYAAANNFLDHLMYSRNQREIGKGRHGISLAINWPLWENGGITISAEEREHLWQVFGMKPMLNEDALKGFIKLLSTSNTSTPCQAVLIEGIADKIEMHLNVERTLSNKQKEVPASGDFSAVLRHMITAVLPEIKVITDTDSFNKMGLSSSALVKLSALLTEYLDTAINPILLIEYNTIQELTAYVNNEIPAAVVTAAAKAAGQLIFENERKDHHGYGGKTSLVDADRSDQSSLLFRKRFSNEEFYMQDHVVDNKYNVPGACYIEMGRQAVSLLGKKVYSLSNNYWPEVLSSAGAPINANIQLIQKGSLYSYEIFSQEITGRKVVHAMGDVNLETVIEPGELGVINLQSLREKLTKTITRDTVYEQIIAEGLHVGPSFMPMKELWTNQEEALGHLILPLHVAETLPDYILHPSMLTGVFQTAIINNKPNGMDATKYIPVAIDEILFTGQLPAECFVHTVAHEENSNRSGIKKFDAVVADLAGNIIARLSGFAIKEITNAQHVSASSPQLAQKARLGSITGPAIESVAHLLKTLLHDGVGLEIEEMDAEISFEELGINSRMIIDLNRLLAKTFGNLSKTLFFEYRNISELAEYFQKKHAAVLQELLASEQLEEEGNVAGLTAEQIFAGQISLATDQQAISNQLVTSNQPATINQLAKAPVSKDIAIVGIGGKYPKADNLAEFWKVLKQGEDCIVEIPEDRFDYKAHFDADKDKGLLYARWGGFINDVDKFDPLFFNISPREAEQIDPQERLFLEVVWATLEDAGITREKVAAQSKKVGVFVGALWQPYINLGVEETAKGNPVAPSGLLYSIPNRVSYFFNWTGPSIAIDTACSASLTALHYACESIRNGDADSCIAGGVNLSLSLSKYLFLSSHNFLATDGRCRSFGIGDGYVPGEGIGAVLLKSLEDAIADGDQIYGVIKGTAVNHSGRTNGYTVPSPNLQGELISSALEKAQLDARTISYVEAHGTGTSLGDPIEMTGLCKAFDAHTAEKQFCAIGSVKANIGHLEATAGIAGLTKILLQFKHEVLVPSIHSAVLNPNISFEDTPFYVPQNLAPWKRPLITNKAGQLEEIPRRAMLSSFGAGGSNAHLIVEEFKQARQQPVAEQDSAIILLSAKNEERLQEQVANLKYFLEQDQSLSVLDIAYTLQTGREAMEERIAFIAKDIPALVTLLGSFLEGNPADYLASGAGYRVGNSKQGTNVRKGIVEQNVLSQAIQTSAWGTIADFWINGQLVDWKILYTGKQPRRISLPTYPFARERYWLPEAEENIKLFSSKSEGKNLHPLVHSNTSDLDQQQFTSTFDGRESFLAHHQVQNKKILPGVAYLELARAAGELSIHQQIKQLKQVSWINPFWVNDTATLHISLFRNQGEVSYEIYSGQEENITLHNSGNLSASAVNIPAAMNIPQLKRALTSEISGQELYRAFDLAGLNLKETFQQVETLYFGEEGALSKIKLANTDGSMYPPGILDSLLHAIYGLMESGGQAYSLVLPFYAGEVNFYQEIKGAKELWGYAVKKKDKAQEQTAVTADFYLLNESGEVLLFFKDFIFLPAENKPKITLKEDASVAFYQQHWEKATLAEAQQLETANQLILIAGGAAGLCDKLQEELGLEVLNVTQEQPALYFQTILENIKSKIQQKGPAHLTVICQHDDYLEYGFISGLLKTVKLEHPAITGKVLSVDSLSVKNLDELAAIIEAEQGNIASEVSYKDGVREIKKLSPVNLNAAAVNEVSFKKDGVYLLTGGAGGLGLLIAAHICSKNKLTLVLTGRSQLTEKVKAELAKIPGAVYHAGDLSDLQDTQKLIAVIHEKYGVLHGVIHSAGVIRDSYILNKTPLQINEVFSAKIQGTKNLDEATKDEPLDFMLFFSSITAIKGNAGQADYAAANAYLNNYAAYRNTARPNCKANGKTLSICWTLWEEGGMQVSKEDLQYLEKQWGSFALPSVEGMKAFDTLLKSGTGEILVTYEGKEVPKAQEAAILTTPGSQQEVTLFNGEFTLDMNSAMTENVSRKIIDVVAALLKLNPAVIKRDKAFGDYGFDSISLTKFARELNSFYELELLPTAFYNYPTVHDLVSFLIEDHQASVAKKHAVSAPLKSIAIDTALAQPAVLAHKRQDFSRERSTAVPVEERTVAPGEGRTAIPGEELTAAQRTVIVNQDQQSLQNNYQGINQVPVAIVGISGRFPGSADLDAFWENIAQNKDLITEIKAERWDWKTFYGDPQKEKNKTKAKWGGFIEDIDKFDPLFFNISPREAALMDPQQRITLEAVYQALEDATIAPDKIRGSDTSIFIGVSTSDYSMLLNNQSDLTGQGHYATGSVHSVLVNRISYLLDLRGASEPVDTACSSSLIAIHRAVAHIRNGDSKIAIAGGVNAILSPELTLSFSEAGMLSDDGRCKTFDESANGYVRGEGVGIVILKALEQAEADGDHIYGIIRGSAENHGGKANTLTSPNPNAQKELLIKAYRSAGIDPRDVTYIEAHGTGTPLGDPIEIEGLKLAFNALYKEKNLAQPDTAYCSIGSVKTNIGHLEAAAGIAGVMKVILSMKHKTLPGNPHLVHQNAYLKLDGSPFQLQQQTTDWKVPSGKPRIAGISSFGFGGANAHLILEEYIPVAHELYPIEQAAIILLSARNADRLKAKVVQLKEFLKVETDLHELAYSLQNGRDAMEERLALVAENQQDLLIQLENYLNDQTTGFLRGNTNHNHADFLLEGTAGKAYVDTAIRNKESRSLAQLWVKGIEIDWKLLYPGILPRRISLPVYPFTRQRCWMPESAKKTVQNLKINQLHPLLHTNESDWVQQQYTAVYTGQESFLADHMVRREKILPGVAYLELARAAGALSTRQPVVRLRNVSWLSPLKLEAGTAAVCIGLETDLSYKIYSQKNQELVYGSGQLITGEPEVAGAFDLETLKAGCSRSIQGTEIYQDFKTQGLNLGTSFTGVTQIFAGAELALSSINLAELEGCLYTPGILDSLLHTIYGLVTAGGQPYTLALPYFVREVHFHQQIADATALWGYARKSKTYKEGDQVISYDLDLLNENGEILVSFRDFVALPPDGFAVIPQEDSEKALSQQQIRIAEPQIFTDQEEINQQEIIVSNSFLKESVEAELVKVVAELISMDALAIERDRKFGDYGFDSILLTRFTNQLNGYYNLDLMPTVFYNYSTIYKLAAFLTEEYEAAFSLKHGGLIVKPDAMAKPLVHAVAKPLVHAVAKPFAHAVAKPLVHAENRPLTPQNAFLHRTVVPVMSAAGYGQQSTMEPIAIIGMSGRFPGSPDLETFWQNISANKDLITEVPADRWDWRKYYGDPLTEKNKTTAKWGGFITDIDKFDSLFFNISPLEAELMDPQQRILMEAVYQALEDGGVAADKIKGSNTGIFIGVSASDYATRLSNETDLSGHMHYTTGSVHSMLVNRISYLLDINGPSEPVDTACSSSLIAIHRAVENIRSGICDMAIAGGVNAMLSPELTLSFSQSGMLSKDGRCKTFDQLANGYVRGEGVGVIILKALSKAEADGDPIYGVIKGTAENHGGKANTLTSPNPIAQRDLLLRAYRTAGIDPRDVSYIEAHGTGTPLGDPIEAEGLKLAFKELYKDRNLQMPEQPYCSIGSVKTNIGHLESAAGIASTIKVLLCLKHCKLPGNPHLQHPNEYLKLDGSIFQLQKETTPWLAANDRPRVAGVSSFGFGGANAHIIIEEYKPVAPISYQGTDQAIVLLSAKTKESLKEQVSGLATHLEKNPSLNLYDVAYTLQTGREALEERLAIVVSDKTQLANKLADYLNGETKSLFAGNSKQGKTGFLLQGGAGQAYINYAIEKKEIASLASLWITGVAIDWDLLYTSQRPARINLPVYPFIKNRYWIPDSGKSTGTGNTPLHPLLHRNESDLKEQKYTSIFTGQEVFLNDHKVQDVKILPGVAYLELARIAGTLSSGQPVTQLKNISWLNPISITGAPINVHTGIYIEEDHLCYEVYNNEDAIHGSGQLFTHALIQPEHLNIAVLQSSADIILNGKEMYQEFLAAGLELGSSYRGVQKMYANQAGCLAKIELNSLDGFRYTPGILDSMLHTIYGFQQVSGEPYTLALPYFMGEVSCYKDLESTSLWTYARMSQETKADDKLAAYDIDLLNASGEVLLSFKNFVALPLGGGFKPTQTVKPAAELHIYQPAWETWVATAPMKKATAVEQQLIWLAGGSETLAETIQERLGIETKAIALTQPVVYFSTILERLKTELKQNASLHLTVVYQNENYAQAGFITGLLQSAVQENPRITGQTIGTDSLALADVAAITELLKKDKPVDAPEIRYVKNILERKHFRPSQLNKADDLQIRENGIYLITGGVGGLGRIFAAHLSKTSGVKVLLTGRKSPDQEIEKLLAEIPGTVYYPCDITVEKELATLLLKIKSTYGVLHGVLHSAGTLRDSFIQNKTQEQIQQVLTPKIIGAQYLDELTKNEPLDFMLFFSSVAAVSGNAGQADYAAANTYLDHYVLHRNEAVAKGLRSGKTFSVNWPLWKSGGMQVSAEGEKYLEKQFGMLPMDTLTGLRTFDELLKAEAGQYAVYFGDAEGIARTTGNELPVKEVASVAATKPSVTAPTPSVAATKPLITTLKPIVTGLEEKVAGQISAIVGELLKLDLSMINQEKEFGVYGFDSLLLTRFTNALNSYYTLELMPTVFYNYPAIGVLTAFLLKTYPEQLAAKSGNDEIQLASPVTAKDSAAQTDEQLDTAEQTNYAQTARRSRFNALKAEHPLNGEPALAQPQFKPTEQAIAIIGISGRFPESPDVATFWEQIKNNKDLITEVPSDRWSWQEYYGDPQKEARKTKAKWGGFITDMDKFDPLFFNISPKEAALMDPQQRITLEAVFHALEDAGIATSKLRGTDTGVFIGVSAVDYSTLLNNGTDLMSRAQFATGAAHSMLVNRISYLLDIHGPSEPVDTACSSSLIAIHRGVEHIRNGHCELAIAGGVNAMLSPELTLSFSSGGMLSDDGRCKSFDQRANGYVRGEGVGIVILKALSKAEADGDLIYGIIRGTAENHGGRANTLTSPNPNAQRDLLVKAYRNANIDPRDVSYIEAHGTGTALGDPIEIEGLKLAFDTLYEDRGLAQTTAAYCSIGSVKTNVGHLESAAGMAGVMKVLMAMKYQTLPGNPHLQSPNAYLQLENTPFRLQKETTAWLSGNNKPRIAGISSFGFGGANAHVIIEEYQPLFKKAYINKQAAIIPLSAKNKTQLRQQLENLKSYLELNPEGNIHEIAYTLQNGREPMAERAVFIARNVRELIHLLADGFSDNLDQLTVADDFETRLMQIAKTWLKAEQDDWSACYPDQKPAKISLPVYPFARNRYWVPEGKKTASEFVEEIEKKVLKEVDKELNNEKQFPEADKTDHLYTPIWSRVKNLEQVEITGQGKCLIITGDAPEHVTRKIQQELSKNGSEVIVVEMLTSIPEDLTAVYLLQGLSEEEGQTLNKGYAQREFTVFRTIKTLLDTIYNDTGLNVTVLTANTQQVFAIDKVEESGSGISGLIGSFAKEQAHWKFRVIDVEMDEQGMLKTSTEKLLQTEFNTTDVLVSYRNDIAYKRNLFQLELPADKISKLKSNGTYVLLGGAGGIGKTTTTYLVEHYQAQVIWLGRRPLDETIIKAQDEVGKLGKRPLYIPCDANDKESVRNAYLEVKNSGLTVNGIFHSGIVLNDMLLKNMSEDDFIKSFEIKSMASHYLVDVFKEDPLDFICFYSSVQSQWSAPGQSNYAAGCTYKDSYAHSIKHRHQIPVHIINWGYWDEVGVVSSPAYKQRMQRLGIGGISQKKGMAILEKVLASNESQVFAVKLI
ncbi:SDR family NAD(P)-dependent oxidoreductase [Pedobacter sp. UYP1]|uniref:SDR family NAD(P)-dependent oxidoreductase n=1 Tax=Pedobacter sp. UYP1 TaxID=1756396 RepID=UPI003396B529